MFLSYRFVDNGPGPSEAIVEVTTADGAEEVIVDRDILKDGLYVGGIISQRQNEFLVELPRESVSGRVRVWVPEDAVKEVA